MSTETLLLGVDGGATLCRARLQAMSGYMQSVSLLFRMPPTVSSVARNPPLSGHFLISPCR
jgi:N-acetylglucosamine kinase-like BadF-type ATPase